MLFDLLPDGIVQKLTDLLEYDMCITHKIVKASRVLSSQVQVQVQSKL